MKSKQEEMVKLLVESGANAEAKDMRNKTPYDYAIDRRNKPVILLLTPK